MRFPIRSQILLPTSIVMLTVVLGSFAINVRLVQQTEAARIEQRIEEVSRILEASSFPLTDRVLQQMAGLTGAEFVLLDENGGLSGTSDTELSSSSFPREEPEPTVGLGETLVVGNNRFFHRIVPLRSARDASVLRLHVFFNAAEYRRIWQQALLPSLLAAGSALIAAVGCAFWIGGSVSKSTSRIMSHLGHIAAGDFKPSTLPSRDDELRDIAMELNRTSEMLERYESEVRFGERMKTMVAMGAGLAHQIRNSATGCRMALDIFAEENPSTEDEGLLVARRQLSLMENYLQRFLLLAKVEPNRIERTTGDLNELIEQAVSLVRHTARHLNADLQHVPSGAEHFVTGDLISIEQAIVNLLMNAIEAATSAAVCQSSGANTPAACVCIETRVAGGFVEVVVRDNGDGPGGDQDLFAPFVSSKQAGIGLGLAVVKDVADEHQGTARWNRADGWTEFAISLPLATEER